MIYIASPFFNPNQLDFVKLIEKALDEEGWEYYSPRSEGILLDQTEEERQTNKKRIYDTNVEWIHKAEHMIAVIDDRDIGTIWEMGYAKAIGVNIVTISNQSYGLNVMLAESVQAHVLWISDAIRALQDPTFKGELLKGLT